MTNKVTYVGLDVHDETLVATWRGAHEPMRKDVFENTEEGIERLVSTMSERGGRVWATYETSGSGFVLHDQLKARGWRVSVLATTRLPRSTKAKKRKTDLEDAKGLLDLLVAHGEAGTDLPAVWVPPVKTREQREVTRHRLKLGEVVGHIRTQIKCLLKRNNIQYPESKTPRWTKAYRTWLGGLPKVLPRDVAVVLSSHLRQLESTQAEVVIMDQELERLSQDPELAPQVEALIPIPGVGLLTAMVFLLEMGDVRRFSNRKRVGSYLGLTPNSYESGGNDDRKGHISRMGPPRLRKVLNQAVWAHVRAVDEEMKWYRQLKYRRGTKKAVVALMRRLGIVMWHRALEARVA